jgi:DUF1680 family protein
MLLFHHQVKENKVMNNVKVIVSRFCVASALLVAPSLFGASQGSVEPLPMTDVTINGFWKQQVKRLTEAWIPHCIEQIEPGGKGEELVNLIATGQLLRGEPVTAKFKGCPWSDAYVYNTIEAICLALEVNPAGDADLAAAQAFLRKKTNEWIPIILAAQEPDGYIHSFHALKKRQHYTKVADHEFYVMGYFLEMGLAHYRATRGRDRRLYDAAIKLADHLDSVFGPSPARAWKNGHAGLELALCRLGEAVNASDGKGKGDKYIDLAKFFLDNQHKFHPDPYNQSEKPAVEMTEATGHAVRATYFYAAMADVAYHKGDAAYAKAVDALWENAIQKKHYLTGGVGASHRGEAFGDDYQLPNNGYCESCASCGLTFWATQMYRRLGDAHFMDVQERAFYNNLLGSVALSGDNFYYQNPLTSRQARYPWHGCPCCVGNIPRSLIAIKDLIYSVDAKRRVLFVNHYVDSEGDLHALGQKPFRMKQQTGYPWKGDVTLTLSRMPEQPFSLALRLPCRTESKIYTAIPSLDGQFEVKVNGQPFQATVSSGYIVIERRWKEGDRVELALPLEIQRVTCDDRVEANRGRVALQRGPVVYNFESVDNGRRLDTAILKPEEKLVAVWKPDLLQGVMMIDCGSLKAIPNYARLNRGGASRVWIIQDRAKAGVTGFAIDAEISASFARSAEMDPAAVNDLNNDSHFDFWPHLGSAEWLQYTFDQPVKASCVKVKWFDDTGHGQCRIPASWRITYQNAKEEWVPVEGVSTYPVAKGKFCEVHFTPVTAKAFRLEIQCPEKFSSGVHEWLLE